MLSRLIGNWWGIGLVALASASSAAWGAHKVTSWHWQAKHEAYKNEVATQTIEGYQIRALWLAALAVMREARLTDFYDKINRLNQSAELVRTEIQVVHREISVTNVGQCNFTVDGLRLVARAADAANDPGLAPGAGSTAGRDAGLPGLPVGAGGADGAGGHRIADARANEADGGTGPVLHGGWGRDLCGVPKAQRDLGGGFPHGPRHLATQARPGA